MSVCEQTCKRVNPYPRNGKYSTVAGEKLLTEHIEQKLSYPMIASASDTPVSDGSEYANGFSHLWNLVEKLDYQRAQRIGNGFIYPLVKHKQCNVTMLPPEFVSMRNLLTQGYSQWVV